MTVKEAENILMKGRAYSPFTLGFMLLPPKYLDGLSSGRAWRYFPVVASVAWPGVVCTRGRGAPRSRA